MKCPVCGNEDLYSKSYYEEVGFVECIVKCDKCQQFEDSWAYGISQFVLKGKIWRFTDHGYMSEDDKINAKDNWQEITAELSKCKFYDGYYDIEEE